MTLDQPTRPFRPAVIHREFQGEVVSGPKDKTIQVAVTTVRTHPKYRKQYRLTKKYPVHDEKNEARVGEIVCFRECRPISKTKRWRLVKALGLN